MSMKKLLALALAAAMVFSIVACTPKDNTTADLNASTTGNGDNPAKPVNASYTYNYSLSEFPTNWNYFTYQTSTDAEILDYITDGFYSFDYNDTMDGYQMVPAMATGDPVDVTKDYVGKFGITADSKNLAWKITLRKDLKWDNGDPITAKDFEESAKLLLDPKAQNSRANSLYSGSFIVGNAEAYLKQGKTFVDPATSKFTVYSEDLDSQLIFSLAPPEGARGEIFMRTEMGFPESYDAAACAAYLVAKDLKDTAFTAEVAAKMEGKTLAEIKADAEMKAAWEALLGWWKTKPNEELHFFLAETSYEAMDWSEVGVYAVSDYELVYIITKPLDGFYLKYNMPAFLVHVDTYNKLAKVDSEGIYTNTYGTSAETTRSYGPYKLTSFQRDKQYILERNENYYGLTEDTYQTTHIQVDCVADAATRLQMFLSGKLDSYGLQKDDMKTYQLSDNTYYYTGASTFAMTFNPNRDALEEKQAAAGSNINKTIITLVEFRQAFSFGLDRAAFCLATSPTNNAAFALYSNLIICDPEAGTAYRTTEAAKDALVDFWGLADDIGAGKLYADKDEAIESISGYNLAKAKQLFNEAYEKAIKEGLMDEDDVIQICIGLPSASAPFYTQGYDFLVNNYTEAVKGTKLEGKLTFTKDDTVGNGFGDALRQNQVDLLFGVGFNGSALDPYGLFEVYVDDDGGLKYDPAIDYSKIPLAININGTDYTTDCLSWYQIMNGDKKTIVDGEGNSIEYSCGSSDNDPETRLQILAALERAVLMNYDFIPIMDNSSASLKGMQIQFKTEEYIFGLGFGGIKYYTYNYTDAEWDAFVAGKGGVLDYT